MRLIRLRVTTRWRDSLQGSCQSTTNPPMAHRHNPNVAIGISGSGNTYLENSGHDVCLHRHSEALCPTGRLRAGNVVGFTRISESDLEAAAEITQIIEAIRPQHIGLFETSKT